MAESLEKYELYDIISGTVYAVFVPASEAAALDLCHKKRHRLLSQVKAASTAPVGRFAESLSDSTVVDGSLWEPPGRSHPPKEGPQTLSSHQKKGPQASSSPTPEDQAASSTCTKVRATGKTGGCWCKQSTQQYLKHSLKHKKELRKRITPLSVYQSISDDLFNQNDLDYSAEQLREKMRNLKRCFKEAKGGHHLGTKWEYFLFMEQLFDLPITTTDDCLEDSHIISGAPIGITDHPDRKTDLNSNTISKTDVGKTYIVKSPMFQHKSSAVEQNDFDGSFLVMEEDDTVLGPKTDGKTYIVNTPMFQHKSSAVEQNDFDGSFLVMEEDDTVSGPKTDGKTYIVNTPMFQHKSSAVDRIDLDTSLLSLEDDDKVTETDKSFDPADAQNYRSPVKKKPNGKGASASVRTPQKTPKRKVAQNSFMWPTDVLDIFLKECIKRKSELSKTPVPLHTWKDISAVLQACGHHYPWDLCRAKFENMLNFFWKSLIPAGGIVCGVKCNYYDHFCLIFDVSKPASNADNGRVWEDTKRSKLLLTLYGDRREEFDKSTNRHDALYAQIASEMSHFDIHVSGAQCRSRLDDLKQEFRAEYDRTRRTGSAPSIWPFFDQMYDMFKGSVTLEAPVSLSVGTTVQHLQKGAAAMQPDTSSRTRPVVAQPKSARNRAAGQKLKETVQQTQVTMQQQQTNAIAEELRKTREAFDRRSEARWKDFLNIVMNQSVPHGATNRDRNFTL